VTQNALTRENVRLQGASAFYNGLQEALQSIERVNLALNDLLNDAPNRRRDGSGTLGHLLHASRQIGNGVDDDLGIGFGHG